jgi:hypothetical protein
LDPQTIPTEKCHYHLIPRGCGFICVDLVQVLVLDLHNAALSPWHEKVKWEQFLEIMFLLIWLNNRHDEIMSIY